MEVTNEDFTIPYYIVEELVEYIELKTESKEKVMKWENIKALLNLAKINNRLSNEQVDFIIKKYSRQKNI